MNVSNINTVRLDIGIYVPVRICRCKRTWPNIISRIKFDNSTVWIDFLSGIDIDNPEKITHRELSLAETEFSIEFRPMVYISRWDGDYIFGQDVAHEFNSGFIAFKMITQILFVSVRKATRKEIEENSDSILDHFLRKP